MNFVCRIPKNSYSILLLKQVFELTEIKTKRGAVGLGLRELVRKAAQLKIREMRGTAEFWPG